MTTAASKSTRTALRTIAHYVGTSVVFVGGLELIPAAFALLGVGERELAPYFIFPGVCAMTLGYLIYFMLGRGGDMKQLNRAEAAACTMIVWLVAIGVYASPFCVAGMLTPAQAIFEATSGLTTTGLSIINPDTCPKSFLIHRSLMHYFGGVGLVLVMTSVLNRSMGLKVYNVEGHVDKLLNGTSSTARLILVMYTGIIAAGTAAYCMAGMPLFDAVNMSISAVSTGGFAVRSESIGFYQSATIELISIVLMLAGATNFLLNFMLLRGKLRGFLTHAETSVFYGIIAITSLAIAALFFSQSYIDSIPDALRTSVFHVVAVITTTGFQTIPSFAALPSSVILILIALMFVGSEAGSTAGGIKVYRVILAVKGLYRGMREQYGWKRRFFSQKVNRFGKNVVCSAEETRGATEFIVIYFCAFAIGCFLFVLDGASIQEAIFEFASCIGNVGVSIGWLTADTSPLALTFASLGMLLGRLEIIPVFMGMHWLLSRKPIGRKAAE